MNAYEHARLEELLDWLADAVAARLRCAPAARAEAPPPAVEAMPVSEPAPGEVAAAPGVMSAPAPPVEATRSAPIDEPPEPAEEPAPAAVAPPSHAARLMGRLAVGLLAAVLLINIPLGLHGTAIARMIPSSTSLVIRDGLLVKEAGSSDVYVYEDGAFHWITDIYVFDRHSYRWQDVHEVEPGFLEDYTLGRPIYLLAMCPSSPHIYRLEEGSKRWIVDIATFEAEGYEWADVQTMSCSALRAIPDGETIPPGHGPAPQP